jgi:nitroreductase
MADEQRQSGLNSRSAQVLDDLVFQRRSVRKYKCDPLPQSWVEAMLRCAHQAPSPSNSQPVRFVRIESAHLKDALKEALISGHSRLIERHRAMNGPARLRNWINAYLRYAEFMFTAPVLLAVGTHTGTEGFSSKLAAAGLMDAPVRRASDVDITVGLALNGLLLKAQSLGVGGCILTAPLVYIKNVEDLLHLDKIAVKCFVTLGMAAETPKSPARMPLDAVVQVI